MKIALIILLLVSTAHAQDVASADVKIQFATADFFEWQWTKKVRLLVTVHNDLDDTATNTQVSVIIPFQSQVFDGNGCYWTDFDLGKGLFVTGKVICSLGDLGTNEVGELSIVVSLPNEWHTKARPYQFTIFVWSDLPDPEQANNMRVVRLRE